MCASVLLVFIKQYVHDATLAHLYKEEKTKYTYTETHT